MTSEADQIRAKRLAKLAAVSSSSPISKASKEEPKPVVAKPGPKPVVTPTKEVPVSTPSTPTSSPVCPVGLFVSESQERWENGTLQTILRVSLVDKSPKLLCLKELAGELQDEGLPLQLLFSNAERVIYSRITLEENSQVDHGHIFDYLLSCWIRSQELMGKIKSLAQNPETSKYMDFEGIAEARMHGLATLQSILLNYSGLVLNFDMAECFPLPKKFQSMGPGYIAHRILPPNVPEDIPVAFMNDFITRFKDEGLDDMLRCIFKSLAAYMRDQNVTKLSAILGALRALDFLISFKGIANQLPSLPDWIPAHAAGRTFEVFSALGPFLARTSVFPDADPAISQTYFPGGNDFGQTRDTNTSVLGSRNQADVDSGSNALRDLFSSVSSQLSKMMGSLVRAGPEAKEGLLAYFAKALKLNQDRGKLQFDPRTVATHGFMYNILHICLSLCDPILDHRYSKQHLIHDHYLLLSDHRLDVSDDTRINADKTAVDEYTKTIPKPPSFNFVTEIFYLTLAYHHYGALSIIRHSGNMSKHLQRMKEQLDKLILDRDRGAFDGPMKVLFEERLRKFQAEFENMIGDKLAFDAILMDKHSIEHSIRFYNLAMVWILRSAFKDSVEPENLNSIDWGSLLHGNAQGLPVMSLSSEPPRLFAIIPEWVLDDICEYYLYVLRVRPMYFEEISRDEITTFAMIFLQNTNYIKNPYLKSKLVEILFHFTHSLYQDATGRTFGKLDDVFITHPLARESLVKCLTTFYIDVEQTGMHSQFYEKFSIRYHISHIFRSIWDDAVHREKFISESRNAEQFVRFAALIMNDTTYLLDESLSKLKEIQTLQIELDQPLAPNSTQEEQETRNQKLEALAQNERQALSCMSLGKETVHMLQYLTGCPEMIDPFMAPEVVDRLAAMLDFNIQALCGPRCSELKVRNPEKYRFNPKELLNELIEIFLHLGHREEFILAVARDGRSYSKDLFYRAGAILYKNSLKNQAEIDEINDFVAKVEFKIKSELSQEEELGDVPDEFLDPLLFTLMEEPVILPASQVTVDLATIKSHLLSDKHDPFNRQPLSIEDVIPNTELKEKIRAWRASKVKA